MDGTLYVIQQLGFNLQQATQELSQLRDENARLAARVAELEGANNANHV